MASKDRFQEVLIPHMQSAYNLAYWIMRSREEAEDVVQDAYIRAFRAFSDLRGEAVKPWLLAIVRNAAYRALENRRRIARVVVASEDLSGNERLDIGDLASTEPSAESRLIGAEQREGLMAAIAALPVDYREVIVLRELEGMSYNEIAETVGVPIGTVMSRLSRARGELREALTRHFAKDEPDAV